ncbi:NMD3-related protein [Candidatus Hodarchaeum mangrovi]
MDSQCIICGKKEEFFKHQCKECYIEANPLIREKINLKIVSCIHCELIFINGHWKSFFLADVGSQKVDSALSKYIVKEWKFNYRPKDIILEDVHLSFNEDNIPISIIGRIHFFANPDIFSPLIEFNDNFEADINWGDCPDCRERFTDVYTSKIQIRSQKDESENTLKQWASEIENLSSNFPQSNGKNPLSKILFVKNGLDALFQTKPSASNVGRIFAKYYNGIVSITTEFSGFDKSKWKEYPRIPVVLINLPPFETGDFILINDNFLQIISSGDGKIEYWDFKRKKLEKIPIKSFIEGNPKKVDLDLTKYQLINIDPKENLGQIMDMLSFDLSYIDTFYIEDIQEGDEFSGIKFNGIVFRNMKQKFVFEEKKGVRI